MSKSVKYIVLPVIAAALLVAGVATVANADDGRGMRPPWGGGKLLERVAQKLNIEPQKLADAFKQASAELHKEAMDSRFDEWVAAGKLTQDQAGQLKAWQASKPDVPFMGPIKMMDKLLEDGKVTQEQYDAYKTWLDQKPNVDLPMPQRPGNGMPGFKGPRCGTPPVN